MCAWQVPVGGVSSPGTFPDRCAQLAALAESPCRMGPAPACWTGGCDHGWAPLFGQDALHHRKPTEPQVPVFTHLQLRAHTCKGARACACSYTAACTNCTRCTARSTLHALHRARAQHARTCTHTHAQCTCMNAPMRAAAAQSGRAERQSNRASAAARQRGTAAE